MHNDNTYIVNFLKHTYDILLLYSLRFSFTFTSERAN